MKLAQAPLRSTASAVAAIAACTGLALAALPQPEPKSSPKPVLLVDFGGVGGLMVDAKDQKLRNALSMLPTRVRELPREIPGAQGFPAPVFDAVLSLLTQPARFALTFDEGRQDEGMFGMGAVLSFGPGEQQKMSQMHGTFNALLAMGGMAGQGEVSAKYDQMLEVPSPMGGVIRYGPRNAADGWRYEVHAGSAPEPDTAFASLPAPAAGFTPVMRGSLDFRPVGPIIEKNLEMAAGPEGEEVGHALEQAGVIGEHALKYTWTMGYTATEQVSTTVIEGLKHHAKDMGIPTESLTPAHFAMIPSDASVASIMRTDLSNIVESLHQLLDAQPEAEEALGQFTAATGVDPLDDLLACLGGTFGFYMSESTGGQLGSIIAFASLKDRPKFEEAHSKLVGFANTMLASEEAARGYARVRAWEDADTKLFTLAFPGLPVPAEITWALQGDWVVFGAMPQSTLAAARQIAGKGDKGLASNASFTGLLPKGGVGSFSFIDTPRVMKDGYQYVALFGSAIANAMRSPTNTEREPGMVVPTFRELRENARPIISYTYWRGDDRVSESHADRSMLVNACGMVGAASPLFPVLGAAIGAAAGSSSNNHFNPAELMDNVIFGW